MAAADALPAITLTDPNNLDQAPSPAQSPTKESNYGDLNAWVRPGTPSSNAKSGHGRTDSSGNSGSAWPSPGRLMRTLSNNTQAQAQNTTASSTAEGNSNNAGSKQDAPAAPAIDPLSQLTVSPPMQHILRRTNAPMNLPANSTNPPRPRTSDANGAAKEEKQQSQQQQQQSRELNSGEPVQEPISRTDTLDSISTPAKELKKGVKAVSFLSRLMGAKKKDIDEDAVEDDDSNSEERPEGNDAEVFTQKVEDADNEGMGFHPRQPQPPAYIKVRAKYKKEKDFDRLFLAQELSGSKKSRVPGVQRNGSTNKLRRKSSAGPQEGDPVWAMEFSRDGKYLAAAGAHMVVRVWAVLGSSDDRQRHEKQESKESEERGLDAHVEHLLAPVFQSEPVREYDGHSSTVLDLSWSKNNFLLSSSMDKTVRLWHVSRKECLCTFKHNDFVPSISFHPKDDRFFLAGSLDSKLRLWSIPDKSVAFVAQVPDMITAVAFTPDGKFAMAGCLSGLCMFYETEGLKYQTQIHVRSTRGQNAKGSKITGIQATYGANGDVKVLITSNDSRVRLYNFRDKSLEVKFKGNENNCSQIRAAVSDCGRYVVCGSEDRKAYIWSFGAPYQAQQQEKDSSGKRDKTPVEMFGAHDSICTSVAIAPAKTKLQLSKSEDPIYDLCNPPPVTLLSQAEINGSQASSRPPTEAGSVQATPHEAYHFERPRESASYAARAQHRGGNIIVTADFTGRIKVFRQDCAWQKRFKDDTDKGSLFRAKRGSRTGSLATRRSERSLREAAAVGRTSMSSVAPSERILNWRQGIASTPSISDRGRNHNVAGSQSSKGTNSRSRSPRKSLEVRGRKEARTYPPSKKDAHQAPKHPLAIDSLVRSPSPMDRRHEDAESHHAPPTPEKLVQHRDTDENPLGIQGGRSYLFWDANVWKGHAERMHRMAEEHEHDPPPKSVSPSPSRSPSASRGDITKASVAGAQDDGGHLAVKPTRPGLRQVPTYVSALSDEVSSGEEGEFEEAREDIGSRGR
ncbi:hypothetical protein M409DRAFT_70997 [Zasmidium cellare ATCC 36951]|uniref:Uncharacterized protein n=1 Tax=Zasmidium cellare ATCC 36951 TaxID=1080233 RepID=A0A6A6BZJ5_ZASCE|nr:uncharacterized protein M409DRAFT_70997 [Zasmidium cellare ATCC 36951]KAF2159428.1 hypothetical protein M409DRAFT_70997 [Zasmidium cellare ATCC 36951]